MNEALITEIANDVRLDFESAMVTLPMEHFWGVMRIVRNCACPFPEEPVYEYPQAPIDPDADARRSVARMIKIVLGQEE